MRWATSLQLDLVESGWAQQLSRLGAPNHELLKRKLKAKTAAEARRGKQ